MVAQGRDAPMRKMQGGQEMRDKATYFRSATGRITGDGMVEDRYDEDAMSPHCQARQPKFNQRPGSQHGPVIVYRAGEEPER